MAVSSIDDVVDLSDRGPNGALDKQMLSTLYGAPKLLPQAWADETPALEYALGRIEAALNNRNPRIELSDVAYPSDLLRALLTAAEARIYFAAMTSGSDRELYGAKYAEMNKLADAQIQGLNPRIATAGGERLGQQSWTVTRG